MSHISELLDKAVTNRICSAAAWSVGDKNGVLDHGVLGYREHGGRPIREDDLWDLASVTKPIVAIAVLSLVERGILRLADTVAEYLPEYRHSDKATISVYQLLTHTSGLPGRYPLYRQHSQREEFLAALREISLRAEPGSAVDYSSVGFILLGLIAETAAAKPLDVLVQENVCLPLGMSETRFRPEGTERCIATEYCPWRDRLIRGEVHDENATVLGGIGAHAGLFSTVADMQRLGHALVQPRSESVLSFSTMSSMTTCHTEKLNLRRGLGWQCREHDGAPVGSALSLDSYGHTGFTGTSLWIEPLLGRYFVLLTNRVHPDRDRVGIARLRRDFHRLAAEIPS